ncbi:MAG TPA: FAD-dependent oxidoreductase [Anaerolineales bacterium]|nr:FAD-dependent oxidoreductase [Anaerolineales bacterium]
MANPLILTVDDEPAVLGAIGRDLRRGFGKDYRILPASSGAAALEALKTLKLRNEPVALFLVDQRMPEMTGVALLSEAIQIFPSAKRVLLTAYADTEAAIRAINEIGLDHYLQKPWDPPEERLYPILQDLLDDWQAAYRPAFEGIRIVGHRWSPQAHQIRDFLARNQVSYRFLDLEGGEQEARDYLDLARKDPTQLPLVFFPDGSYLTQPSNVQVAEKVGLQVRAEKPFYDLIIVGAGPAGLAAGVYAASEGLRTLIIEREAPGGQAGMSSRIENYLGFPVGLSGGDLARRAVAQALRFGAEILTPLEACAIRPQDSYRVVSLAGGVEHNCHAVLIATGVSYRKLDVAGIEPLTGAGVYYGAAITEALSCMGKDVYVLGGGNSAGQAAMYLCKYARKVTILTKSESLAETMSQYLIDQIGTTENIQVWPCCQVVAVDGAGALEVVCVRNLKTQEESRLPAAALFIFIGAQPRTEWVAELVERDDQGFIFSGPDLLRDGRYPRGWQLDRAPFWLETSVPGIFVAGDVRHQSVKRVASAVGEGAMAVQFIHRYLAST